LRNFSTLDEFTAATCSRPFPRPGRHLRRRTRPVHQKPLCRSYRPKTAVNSDAGRGKPDSTIKPHVAQNRPFCASV
jgi:hypothetical protein